LVELTKTIIQLELLLTIQLILVGLYRRVKFLNSFQ